MASELKLALRKAEIAFHARLDRALAPRARSASDVPWHWKAITPQWMTATLCKDFPGARILAVDAAGGSVGTSSRQALDLELNEAAREAGLPARVFTKSTPMLKQRLLLGDCLFGEAGFYRDFRPQIDLEAPLGYWACVGHRSLRSTIVMEDVVSTRGAAFNMDGTASSVDEMAGLLTSLARLHARFWRDGSLSDRKWLRDTPTYLDYNHRFLAMAHWAKVGMTTAPDLLPTGIGGRIDDIWRGIMSRNARDRAGGNFTLLHGDAHIAQTYKTNDGKMGFCDWQVMLRGPWAWDVSYIMSTGLEIEDRRSREEELLRGYADELAASGGPALDRDSLRDAYRAHIPYAFVAWAFTIGYSTQVREVQPSLTIRRLVERTAAAMRDHGSIELNLREC